MAAPPWPDGFEATATGTTTIRLNWQLRSGVEMYYIAYRNASGSIWTEIARPGGTVSTYDVSGLACGTTYRFAIKGHGDGQTYAEAWGTHTYVNRATNSIGATDTCLTPPGMVAPPRPDGFEATATGTTTIRLNWQLRSGVEMYYITHRNASGSIWTEIARPGGTVSTYDVSGLACGTTYVLAVLDTAAERAGQSRSALLTQAALGIVKGPRQPVEDTGSGENDGGDSVRGAAQLDGVR